MQSRIDLEAGRIAWRIEPPVLGEAIKVAGTFAVVPHPEGCERTIEGDVEVGIPMAGKRLEQVIVDRITQGYEMTAKLRTHWVAERGKAEE